MLQVSVPRPVDLTATVQYCIMSEGNGFRGDKLRELPDPIPVNNHIIPNQDMVPSSILNHPIDNKHEADFGVYEFLTPTALPPVDGPYAV